MRSNCAWLTATCDGASVSLGCYRTSADPTLSDACSSAGPGTAERDAGTVVSDTSAPLDGNHVSCGTMGQSSCRSTERCKWWQSRCGSDVLEARCIPRDSYPTPPRCRDATNSRDAGSRDGGRAGWEDADASTHSRRDAEGGMGGNVGEDTAPSDAGTSDTTRAPRPDARPSCMSFSNASTCRKRSHCRWWTAQCGGKTIVETCISRQTQPPPVQCKGASPANCHLARSKSDCALPHCRWVTPGCGGGTGRAIEVEGCMPRTPCSTDADCPGKHRCRKIWHNPCEGRSCRACGRAARRCVPPALMP